MEMSLPEPKECLYNPSVLVIALFREIGMVKRFVACLCQYVCVCVVCLLFSDHNVDLLCPVPRSVSWPWTRCTGVATMMAPPWPQGERRSLTP